MKKLTGLDLTMEFPLRSTLRDQLDLEDKEFTLRGQLSLQSPSDAQEKAFAIQNLGYRDFSAGELLGASILSSAWRLMLRQYKEKLLPQIWNSIQRSLERNFGPVELDNLLSSLLNLYPSTGLYRGIETAQSLLEDPQLRDSWVQICLENLLLLDLWQDDPALEKMRPLVLEEPWSQWKQLLGSLDFLEKELEVLPGFGAKGKHIVEILREPIEHSPILKEQLEYIRKNWGEYLEDLLPGLLQGQDLLAEETQVRLPGPGPAQGVDFQLMDDDDPHYSPDSNWMPQVILLAKNALVWLFQLSKEYQRPIEGLNDIPDEELDRLRGAGFTGLWLIGLWERSSASQEIKKRCGNPEAEASAYSLHDYSISDRLGGWSALVELKERCAQRGIRLASDMVPNHTGIDSAWVKDHPEWFISRKDSPYPQYSYEGDNLSSQDSMEIYLEDHYYDQSDCAVCFKRVDRSSGEVSYIYHGNDGTSMPWNDTAQIDFLNPEAREAVIQQIISVAQRFPIIRFDAAMVLARRHIRRLWFPKPGEGGAIPSRSEMAISDQDFHNAMPEEFWREVVERVAQECPDTLLLAEAFWMMEGYFVRNLGMHRVYNSAFMNMIKDEKNQEYRDMMKGTLDYDPEILKRFVNFMSNPDEDTADAQFGRGDKYFGVLAMMLTMPGLPMLSHGQLEGYTEKYGMEYSRAYYDEKIDQGLMERHGREIFPIMKLRPLFAEARNFHLYDIQGSGSSIQEWIYAYSNHWDGKASLFIYNNRMEQCAGRIQGAYKKDYGLAAALGLQGIHQGFVVFQEQRSGLWFIRHMDQLQREGLYFHLSGYEYQLFLNFSLVEDSQDYLYSAICSDLNGRGTPSMDQAIQNYKLKPLYRKLERVLNYQNLWSLSESFHKKEKRLPEFLKDRKALELWLQRIHRGKAGQKSARALAKGFVRKVKAYKRAWKQLFHFHGKDIPNELMIREEGTFTLALWLFIDLLSQCTTMDHQQLLEEWDLIEQLQLRFPDQARQFMVFNLGGLIKGFAHYKDWFAQRPALNSLAGLFDDSLFQELCGVNLHDQVLWFNQQGFQDITAWLFILTRLDLQQKPLQRLLRGQELWKVLHQWMKMYDQSGFRVQHMRVVHRNKSHGP